MDITERKNGRMEGRKEWMDTWDGGINGRTGVDGQVDGLTGRKECMDGWDGWD